MLHTPIFSVVGGSAALALLLTGCASLSPPPPVDVLPTAADNHALYFWLTALAAHADPAAPLPADTAGWLAHNHRQTAQVLARLPGLATRYATLVTAHLACRPDPRTLPAAEAALEQAIRQALTQPHAALPPFPQTMPRHPPDTGLR